MATEPGSNADVPIALTLRRSSWENLFSVVGEYRLGEVPKARADYLMGKGVHVSPGNFWAAIQSLQGGFAQETGHHPPTDLLELEEKDGD